MSNYRPISLLCILSKVLERIVYNNIINRVREQSTKHQFGFLPRRSTLQQLLVFAEKVFEPNKCEVDVVYMDFKKAFDSVSHHHLLGKLQTFGITGKARQWFEAYLHNLFIYFPKMCSLSLRINAHMKHAYKMFYNMIDYGITDW